MASWGSSVPVSPSCERPPAAQAAGRRGLANRRSFLTDAAFAAVVFARCFVWWPAVAARVGLGSFSDRPSSRLTLASLWRFCLGTGTTRETFFRCPYV